MAEFDLEHFEAALAANDKILAVKLLEDMPDDQVSGIQTKVNGSAPADTKPAEAMAEAKPEPPQPPRGAQFGKLLVLSVADIDTAQPRSYLLKGLISPNEISLWVGPPKCGKSFLMLHIAYLLSLGRPVFGRRVKPARILYVAAEGEHGIINRIEALRRKHGDSPNFHFIAQPVDLLHPYGHLADLKSAAKNRNLVVLDTLSRALAGGDENSPSDMGTVVAHVTELRHDTNAHVAIVHHGTKQSNGVKPRGHSCLEGADDALVEVVKDEQSGIRSARVAHAKDDADGWGFTFKLDSVELGTDDDGDPISTLIVQEMENHATKKKPAITGQAQRALQILSELIAQTGREPPPPLPVVQAVTKDEWRKQCAVMSLAEADDAHSQGNAFKRVFQALAASGSIETRENWVWLGCLK